MNQMTERLTFACETAKKAGHLALDYFSNLSALTIVSKGAQDMMTEADVNVENLIRKAIETKYPEDDFFGEESSDSYQPKSSCGIWVVDPIDGTQPFINSIRSWCISIAYIVENKIVIGVVYDPCANELFAAEKNCGATLNGKAIQASNVVSVANGLIGIGYSNRVTPEDILGPLGRLIRAQGMYHRNGSAALSLAYVAAGRLIGYFEPHLNCWDFAAGLLLIEEAGGEVYASLSDDNALIKGSVVIGAAKGVYPQLEAIVKGVNNPG